MHVILADPPSVGVGGAGCRASGFRRAWSNPSSYFEVDVRIFNFLPRQPARGLESRALARSPGSYWLEARLKGH